MHTVYSISSISTYLDILCYIEYLTKLDINGVYAGIKTTEKSTELRELQLHYIDKSIDICYVYKQN